jgi:hypothetical protein
MRNIMITIQPQVLPHPSLLDRHLQVRKSLQDRSASELHPCHSLPRKHLQNLSFVATRELYIPRDGLHGTILQGSRLNHL